MKQIPPLFPVLSYRNIMRFTFLLFCSCIGAFTNNGAWAYANLDADDEPTLSQPAQDPNNNLTSIAKQKKVTAKGDNDTQDKSENNAGKAQKKPRKSRTRAHHYSHRNNGGGSRFSKRKNKAKKTRKSRQKNRKSKNKKRHKKYKKNKKAKENISGNDSGSSQPLDDNLASKEQESPTFSGFRGAATAAIINKTNPDQENFVPPPPSHDLILNKIDQAKEAVHIAPDPLFREIIIPNIKKKEIQAIQESFTAIRRKDWHSAYNRIKAIHDPYVRAMAYGQYYTSGAYQKNQSKAVAKLLIHAPYLIQYDKLITLLPGPIQDGVKQKNSPSPTKTEYKRIEWDFSRRKPKAIGTDAISSGMRRRLQQFIKQGKPGQAEQFIARQVHRIKKVTLTEFQQRVAWSYYIEGEFHKALQMANMAHQGAGAWAYQARWTAGLSAWRLKNCNSAIENFTNIMENAHNAEWKGAGAYWLARSYWKCGDKASAHKALLSASTYDVTFYGMLALAVRGKPMPALAPYSQDKAGLHNMASLPNMIIAAKLNAAGEYELSEKVARHQASITPVSQYGALHAVVQRIGLPRTQLWLAHNAPAGHRPPMQSLFPNAGYTPHGGWQVDKALLFAHSLQESAFHVTARSPAKAQGLMQLRPGTARYIAKNTGRIYRTHHLNRPDVNLCLGQDYIQYLRGLSATSGTLPKIIAAYNAGPTPVARWGAQINADHDPLLFMESIPYYETREYVSNVLRNYWMYTRILGGKMQGLRELANDTWPNLDLIEKNDAADKPS